MYTLQCVHFIETLLYIHDCTVITMFDIFSFIVEENNKSNRPNIDPCGTSDTNGYEFEGFCNTVEPLIVATLGDPA